VSSATVAHANPCVACQQQHSAVKEFAAWEQPLQSLAVSAAMHVAGLQLHSAQRIVAFAIHHDPRHQRGRPRI